MSPLVEIDALGARVTAWLRHWLRHCIMPSHVMRQLLRHRRLMSAACIVSAPYRARGRNETQPSYQKYNNGAEYINIGERGLMLDHVGVNWCMRRRDACRYNGHVYLGWTAVEEDRLYTWLYHRTYIYGSIQSLCLEWPANLLIGIYTWLPLP